MANDSEYLEEILHQLVQKRARQEDILSKTEAQIKAMRKQLGLPAKED